MRRQPPGGHISAIGSYDPPVIWVGCTLSCRQWLADWWRTAWGLDCKQGFYCSLGGIFWLCWGRAQGSCGFTSIGGWGSCLWPQIVGWWGAEWSLISVARPSYRSACRQTWSSPSWRWLQRMLFPIFSDILLETSTKSTSHSVTIAYGDKDLVDFNEISKYCSLVGAMDINHQCWLSRSQWLSDWDTNSVPRGTEYLTIVCIVRTIVRYLPDCLRVAYISVFPISSQLQLTSLVCYCWNHKLTILESVAFQLSLFLKG